MNLALLVLDDDLPLDYIARQSHSTHASFFQTVTVVGVLILFAAIIFGYVALVHKPRRRRKRRPHRHGDEAVPVAQSEKKPAPVESSGRRKHRRREHRPRNPTLAETHGLPPVRDEEAGSHYN